MHGVEFGTPFLKNMRFGKPQNSFERTRINDRVQSHSPLLLKHVPVQAGGRRESSFARAMLWQQQSTLGTAAVCGGVISDQIVRLKIVSHAQN
jgi:hypothetical protein